MARAPSSANAVMACKVPPALRLEAQSLAAERGMTTSRLIRHAIEELLKQAPERSQLVTAEHQESDVV